VPRLYFIRHGETDWNRDGRLQGGTETALNARGRKQAAIAATHLVETIEHVDGENRAGELPFHASPMLRTRQTIEILRTSLGLEPAEYRADARLREIGFGTWEGRTWYEIRARDPIAVRERENDPWGHAPPGGESYAMVAERVAAWLETIREDAIVIAHGGIARVMMALHGGVAMEAALKAEIWQGKILCFEDGVCRWLPSVGHH
jgi:broad specificity phosphatase PhoE